MKTHYFSQIRLDDALLYAMQGCYLLHLPMYERFSPIESAFVGDNVVVLVGHQEMIVVPVNTDVGNLFIDYAKENPDAVLAVLMEPELEGQTVEALSFPAIKDFSLLRDEIGEQHYHEILAELEAVFNNT